MSRRKFATRQQNAVSFKEQARSIGPVSNAVILVILACLLGLLYLTQVTKTTASGYAIEELRTEYSQLQKEHEDLELTAARLQSLDRIANSPANQNLVSVAPAGAVQ